MKRLVSVLSIFLLGVEILDDDCNHQDKAAIPNKR